MHVLILGGTTEARSLAGLLHGTPGLRLTSSLAGRVAAPRLPEGEVRVGGFGGVEGLAEWLREQKVRGLIDATHPFARTISFHAAEAAAIAHVPLLALRRPGWVRTEGDRWRLADSLEEAARLLPELLPPVLPEPSPGPAAPAPSRAPAAPAPERRVFLSTGRMGLAAFAACDGVRDDLWFLVRSVDEPEGLRPARTRVLLDRGPFTLEGERELLARHRIEVLVTKDSGGAATAPKLTAAREAGIPVVVVRRPPVPEGVAVAPDPEGAARWVAERLTDRAVRS
ncbi:cobalt-precorrin-6A reductase [Streptomyces jumonjinensis]|uniref:Cobalt-precorrin-6A reductase n=1 Tax=Streptomyces jumonjinensis TaxID=1945 RepID=A0A646KN23_STRJU|nr:cobalt-precorrin-6A reductase [Streptomyces jumonjinensis]MQT03458.1 cobalt-precorrin-6A reductase [Streptomyces jumonjinensis]